MDWSLTHLLNVFLTHHDAIEDPLLLYVKATEALFAGGLVLAFLLGARRVAIEALVATGIALLVGKVISTLVDRPRPFVSHHVHLFAQHGPDPGFPSDHATAAFAIATTVLLANRRWGALAMTGAVVLSVGRVALGLHYPTDVLAGAALGALSALAVTRLRAVRSPVGRGAAHRPDPARPEDPAAGRPSPAIHPRQAGARRGSAGRPA